MYSFDLKFRQFNQHLLNFKITKNKKNKNIYKQDETSV